ncbi:MAG: DEAD/DEAH box helicase [Bacteroidota bacterium]
MRFKDFDLDEGLLEGIEAMGYELATPVQEKVIPTILAGKDLIASAQTGTGKTAAFLLPIIHKLVSIPHDTHSVNALIIVPTRELAVQISQHMEAISYFTNISAIAVYGGGDGELFGAEKKALSKGVDMVICTPGRMIAHLNMGYVKLNGLKFLVLDEADRMLDMGFHGDIMKILSYLPKERQSLMFSATMPPKIRELANKLLHEPEQINISISKPPEKINQQAYVVFEEQKIPLIKHLLKNSQYRLAVVFCSKKDQVKKLTYELKKARLLADEIHSDLEQLQREKVLLDYRNGKINILVATDILSRGIDIDTIDLVINYDVPHDGEDYVHRIGRTARAEAIGTAYTFISPKEQRKFGGIERLIGITVNKDAVPEQFGPAPDYNPGSSSSGGGGGSHRGSSGRPHSGGFKKQKQGGGNPAPHNNGQPRQKMAAPIKKGAIEG